MNEKLRPKYLVWVGLALVALVGIGLIAFLVGQLQTPLPKPPTSTTIPTPTPPPTVTVSNIKKIAELATIEYNEVAELDREHLPQSWLDEMLGTKERVVMLVYGKVKAGFDLEKLKDNDLWTDGKRVRLVLPAPQILSTTLDFNRTHIVFYQNNMLLEKNDPNLPQDALSEAQKALEQTALQNGILKQANNYGKLYFENFFYSLGYTDVEVVADAQIYKE
jgi:hypothetical protein